MNKANTKFVNGRDALLERVREGKLRDAYTPIMLLVKEMLESRAFLGGCTL